MGAAATIPFTKYMTYHTDSVVPVVHPMMMLVDDTITLLVWDDHESIQEVLVDQCTSFHGVLRVAVRTGKSSMPSQRTRSPLSPTLEAVEAHVSSQMTGTIGQQDHMM